MILFSLSRGEKCAILILSSKQNCMYFFSIKTYFRYLPNTIVLFLSLLVNFLIWFWIIWQIRPQTEPIFLHYNILFGIDYLDVWWKIYYLPIAGLIMFMLNLLLSWFIFTRDKFISLLLNFTSLVCQVFLFIGALLIILLNV